MYLAPLDYQEKPAPLILIERSIMNSQQNCHLNLEGYKYYYKIAGDIQSATPVLCLGGAFQSIESWKKYEKYYANKVALILCDLPGCGDADFLPVEYGIEFQGEAVRLLLDTIRIKNIFLACASYGTAIGYYFAGKYSEYVKKLVMMGAAKSFPENIKCLIEENLRLIEKRDIEACSAQLISFLLCHDPQKIIRKRKLSIKLLQNIFKYMSEYQINQYIANTRRLLNTPSYENFPVPTMETLVFTGEYDTFTPPSSGKEVASLMPNSRFTTIPMADHLFHIEQFDYGIELIDSFFFGDNLNEKEE